MTSPKPFLNGQNGFVRWVVSSRKNISGGWKIQSMVCVRHKFSASAAAPLRQENYFWHSVVRVPHCGLPRREDSTSARLGLSGGTFRHTPPTQPWKYLSPVCAAHLLPACIAAWSPDSGELFLGFRIFLRGRKCTTQCFFGVTAIYPSYMTILLFLVIQGDQEQLYFIISLGQALKN